MVGMLLLLRLLQLLLQLQQLALNLKLQQQQERLQQQVSLFLISLPQLAEEIQVPQRLLLYKL
jgi:hypothetical protein